MIVGVKMHADEVDIDESLVRRLVAGQFPEWVGLPIELVASSGTDNAMFRLGTDLAVRMPRMTGAAKDVAAEQKWVPLLAPHLPVAVPTPVACGEPAEGYPYQWTVCRWLPGTNPAVDDLASPEQLARDLGAFIVALRCVDPVDAPPAGRGVPLATRDKSTRAAIAASDGLIDTAAVTAVWQDAMRIPAWSGRPAWTHADLSPGNLLVRDGRLAAVIDWGIAGVGDPTVDLIVAWNLLPVSARLAFREVLAADDDTWHRGRGWALSISLIQLPYYQHTNPALAANSRHVIAEILADAG
ncbi:aminoglycoside phosphotransferase (APT) family kinase protein [Amycolatopsis cihanbeyliensis]|uniref:Aminoglycoside phosphotransferase (APT) family kinase protein n=2 Tax=Amycolatopsis cihanbeyliensis TaxID=1128664 RepID=A0A542DG99_AMYCI|nr:aminoglycoside phosphotransferase (APT) family kinase protein [Amycolatopsis cihanbeyliensis]